MTRPLRIVDVVNMVSRYYSVSVHALNGPRRNKYLSHARAVAMYLARKHTNRSYPELGRAFGGKHHSTVISAVQKVSADSDSETCAEIRQLESLIGACTESMVSNV